MTALSLQAHELTVAEVHRNDPASSLHEHAIRYEKDASIADHLQPRRVPGDRVTNELRGS